MIQPHRARSPVRPCERWYSVGIEFDCPYPPRRLPPTAIPLDIQFLDRWTVGDLGHALVELVRNLSLQFAERIDDLENEIAPVLITDAQHATPVRQILDPVGALRVFVPVRILGMHDEFALPAAIHPDVFHAL